MNVNIKTALLLFAVAISVISALLVWAVLDLSRESKKLELIEHNRYLMFERADELRQSSDDLTRYARLYVSTGDESNKDAYYNILSIRNGKAKRPVAYAAMYWGISEPIRSQRHPLGKPSSLKEEMHKLPYLHYEFAKLEEAEFNSNKLVLLEVQAFNVANALFMDGAGGSTGKSGFNQQSAIGLLVSKEYHHAKEKVMLPIDDFLHSLIGRTKESISLQQQSISKAFRMVFILLFIGILTLVIAGFFVSNRVLSPIGSLTSIITAFKNGDEPDSKKIAFNDEIGVMTEQFFEMKDALDVELLKSKELATIDPLTGIKNRRHFYEIGEPLLEIARRSNEPLSILMLDIDYFKAINDSYGHIIGDDVLIHVTREAGSQLRKSDIFARYGGEEFIVLLPKTNIAGAVEIAEKIRLQIELTPFAGGKVSVPVTISIGAAELNQEQLMRQLTQKADEALYKAKEGGRNRVVSKYT